MAKQKVVTEVEVLYLVRPGRQWEKHSTVRLSVSAALGSTGVICYSQLRITCTRIRANPIYAMRGLLFGTGQVCILRSRAPTSLGNPDTLDCGRQQRYAPSYQWSLVTTGRTELTQQRNCFACPTEASSVRRPLAERLQHELHQTLNTRILSK